MKSGSSALCAILVLAAAAAARAEPQPLQVNETATLQASRDQPAFLSLSLNLSAETQAVRVFVSSAAAESLHPLLVTVRQPRAVTLWTLPYVEAGYAHYSVNRTLCPLWNTIPDSPDPPQIMFDVSTSSLDLVNFTLSTSIVEQFYLQLNEPASLTVSPSAPAYATFYYDGDVDKVRVKFTSQGRGRDVCAIAAVQKSLCPVVEVLDSPEQRGTFQTMQHQAAITTQLEKSSNISETPPTFLHVVVSVFPDDSECSSTQHGLADSIITASDSMNFDPELYGGERREKTVTITIQPALPARNYAAATILATLVYLSIYIVVLVWITVYEWHNLQAHPTAQHLTQHQPWPESIDSVTMSDEAGEGVRGESVTMSDEAGEGVRGESVTSDEVDSRAVPVEETDFGGKTLHASPGKTVTQNKPSPDKQASPRSRSLPRQQLLGEKWKRPNLWQVLLGRHWKAIQKQQGTAPPSSIDPTRSLPSSLPSSLPPSRLRQTSSGTHYPHHHPPTRSLSTTHHSHSGTYHHSPSTHTRHSFGKSRSTEERSRHKTSQFAQRRALSSDDQPDSGVDPSSPYSPPGVDPSSPDSPPGVDPSSPYSPPGVDPSSPDSPPGVDPSSPYSPPGVDPSSPYSPPGVDPSLHDSECVHQPLRKRQSYNTAINQDPLYLVEEGRGCCAWTKKPLHVNLLLYELESEENVEAAGSSQYSWYLLTVIIFYCIPAVQLVTAYQQFLNISGNEDVCYYNTLCSHPLKFGHSFTISAFNNLFSNVGYLLLGLLLAAIAYRRKREYEVLNLHKAPHERCGVPQQHGVYFAISLALVAEGFMSATYHICPSSANYQFDTTYMFILAGLGLYQLVLRRCPDLLLPVHYAFFMLALIIVVAVIGGTYSGTVWFYPVFFIVYLLLSLGISVENYYRWQLRYPGDVLTWWEDIRDRPLNIKHKPKFVVLILSTILNFIFAVYSIAVRPPDFGSYFLTVFISNLGLLLVGYGATKIVYRERPTECSLWPVLSGLKPLLFLGCAVVFWGCAVVFYTEAVTNWLEPPAVSRNSNKECILLGFYDHHDMWHFLSAFALFFSFLLLMSLDDNENRTPRKYLRVF